MKNILNCRHDAAAPPSGHSAYREPTRHTLPLKMGITVNVLLWISSSAAIRATKQFGARPGELGTGVGFGTDRTVSEATSGCNVGLVMWPPSRTDQN